MIKEVDKIQCDRCKILFDDFIEIQEFLNIDFIGGYGSIFGDGSHVECDICQTCLQHLLGKALRVEQVVK